ncbi:MAG TPA: NYN domain-containing protein, partial [Steroidobacteraceae bacterium]|nr:NYN domain-containing protein [Steroidobacteraceae bacterium]
THVDTFVVISGDSDFSPLVSKLRENDKAVIGVGVKNSTSDLLIANCDEFIYYDDLVREPPKPRRGARKKAAPDAAAAGSGRAGGEAKDSKEEDRQQAAFDLVLATLDALVAERGAEDKIWGSMIKQALKRQRPGFSESYYGFRSFNNLLEEAAQRRLLTLERDDKSGGYLVHSNAEAP